MKELSKFYGDGIHRGRNARVLYDGGVFYVEMKQGLAHTETRSMGIHSEQYAEDAAENWVLGIIK